MKRKRFSEEQIIGVLKDAEAGAKPAELCRRHRISEAIYYSWRSTYAGMTISEARRLPQLEKENHRLKRLRAEAELDKAALKDLISRKRKAHSPSAMSSTFSGRSVTWVLRGLVG